MTTIVIRSRKKELDPKNPLHQVQRAIVWPDDAISAYRESMYAPWKFTTKQDVLREKRKRMEHRNARENTGTHARKRSPDKFTKLRVKYEKALESDYLR